MNKSKMIWMIIYVVSVFFVTIATINVVIVEQRYRAIPISIVMITLPTLIFLSKQEKSEKKSN